MYLMFCWWGGNVYTLTPKASEMHYTYAAPSSKNGIKYTGMASVFPVSAPLAQKNCTFLHCVLWFSMQEPSIDASFCMDQFLHHHISCLSFALCFMIFHLRNQWILMLSRFSMLQDPFIECGEFSILRRRRQVVVWYLVPPLTESPLLCSAALGWSCAPGNVSEHLGWQARSLLSLSSGPISATFAVVWRESG